MYTSSASVVFEGKDLIGVNEDQPYAGRPLDFYTRTKVPQFRLGHLSHMLGRQQDCSSLNRTHG